MQIVDSSGTVITEYAYDPWGKVLGITGSQASSIGNENPFRYRSYYYDDESGFYYLNSRYYDPTICRFISADEVGMLSVNPHTAAEKNLYAYCANNPIVYEDSSGQALDMVFDIVSCVLSVAEFIDEPSLLGFLGVMGDIADIALPMVGGIGETVRSLKTADKIADTAAGIKKTEKSLSAARQGAVRRAWKLEVDNVRNGGLGRTRQWNDNEIRELLTNGKVKGYHGHHMKSVKKYEKWAGDEYNVQFLTPAEHLDAHKGNWKNSTDGWYDYTKFGIGR